MISQDVVENDSGVEKSLRHLRVAALNDVLSNGMLGHLTQLLGRRRRLIPLQKACGALDDAPDTPDSHFIIDELKGHSTTFMASAFRISAGIVTCPLRVTMSI